MQWRRTNLLENVVEFGLGLTAERAGRLVQERDAKRDLKKVT